MKENIQSTHNPIHQPLHSAYVKRSPVDRRSLVDRRILDMGPGYPGQDRRINLKDRRRGWEDRYGWERISKWSSSPLYSDIP